MEDADPSRVLPVEAWTNGRHGTLLAAAHGDQVTFLLADGTVLELELSVFRQLMLRMLIAAYSS